MFLERCSKRNFFYSTYSKYNRIYFIRTINFNLVLFKLLQKTSTHESKIMTDLGKCSLKKNKYQLMINQDVSKYVIY